MTDVLPYPFDRLRSLLAGTSPRSDLAPIDVALGEPRRSPPGWVDEILAANAADWRRYPPVGGTDAFRAAAAGWLCRRYRLGDGMIDPATMILPASGTREALFQAAALAVDVGTRVDRPAIAFPDPFYAVYFGAAIGAEAEPVPLPPGPSGFPDPDRLAADPDLLARLVMVTLCHPSNPQGTVVPSAELAAWVKLARAHGFILAVDECYAEIYRETPPTGVLEVADGRLDGLLAFHSLSKRSSAAGLRSGFVVGDPKLINRFRRWRGFSAAGMPLPVQAASAALWADDSHVGPVRDHYNAAMSMAAARLGPLGTFAPPPGGFFAWLDVGDGEDAARRAWQLAGVRALPGRYLSAPTPGGETVGDRYLRLALVDSADTVATMADRLVAALSDQYTELAG